MLNVIILNVIMLNVIPLSSIMKAVIQKNINKYYATFQCNYNNKTCCHNGVRFLSDLLIESQKYK